jgi:D-arabinose 1-dehydrogenase-like Zn-dependent alcohol dehydrogenase
MSTKTKPQTEIQGTATPVPSRMRAIVQRAYGSADTLEFVEIDRPESGPEQVLIEVEAAGVDRGVWHLMTGLPYVVRFAGYGLTKPKIPVPGMDVSGRVVGVGADVERFQVGDEVFGIARGSYAEYAVAMCRSSRTSRTTSASSRRLWPPSPGSPPSRPSPTSGRWNPANACW